jgi:hypothetical protein
VNYPFRQADWSSVLHLLKSSLFAEEMVCSMSTQLFHIPETSNLRGNAEMHEHLVPASYHRVTSVGSANRLTRGERDPSIVSTLTACIQNAKNRDQKVLSGLHIMKDAAPAQYKLFVENIISWQHQTQFYLDRAQQQLVQMGIPIGQSGQYSQYS